MLSSDFLLLAMVKQGIGQLTTNQFVPCSALIQMLSPARAVVVAKSVYIFEEDTRVKERMNE